jgi:hypothetical protein
MSDETNAILIQPGMILEWSDAIRSSENFPNYVALVGQGPFAEYEVTLVSKKPPVYGDERFRDGMRVPEKLLDPELRTSEASQVGHVQRIKIHVVDPEGHHVAAEFPGHFFQPKQK